uniref:Uncharacterized protein n=2 Tax=Meloidogyne TaxID=189290 RepID=A0A915NGM0_9BILA
MNLAYEKIINRKGKAVMGSFSKRQKIPTNVVTQNTKEAIMEFSLPQLTFLIKILQSITEEDLNSDNIFIEIVDRYSNEIGSFMQNPTDINLFKDTQQKIKTVK